MKFPTVGEIATKNVVSINIRKSIAEAVRLMFENDHRNVVVVDGSSFRILIASDILKARSQNINLSDQLNILNLEIIPTMTKGNNVLQTLEHLSCNIEYICVVDDDGSLYGLVTHTDIISNIDPETLMESFCLHDFLKLSKRDKWIKKEMKTSHILNEMAQNSLDSVIIIEDFKPLGIFTTKDVIRVIKNSSDLELPVSSYMSSPVDTIFRGSSIKEAVAFLKNKHYKRAVVVDKDGNMHGVVSQKELISLAYSKWASLMKEHHEELDKINSKLLSRSKKYEIIASTDPLTGLYNRYKFSKLYELSYSTMMERSSAVSLLILDIDNFKKINDTHGHNTGDTVLVKLANLLQGSLRDMDIVCRWGGEEFVLLLLATNLKSSVLLAEKLRENIEKLEIDTVGKITASFGIAELIEGDDLKSTVGRADKALYLAKESGRNCVRTQNEVVD
ncbi:diguanylate cyclase [Sulfurimonas sp.]|uniref:diguanylate cyclase n=1 Tax=Sulfurimonas sp. TaxID=2022749 RepID=UPI0025CFBD1A|nr:diguanylate cyclase [Sulfurimonas sp.]